MTAFKKVSSQIFLFDKSSILFIDDYKINVYEINKYAIKKKMKVIEIFNGSTDIYNKKQRQFNKT